MVAVMSIFDHAWLVSALAPGIDQQINGSPVAAERSPRNVSRKLMRSGGTCWRWAACIITACARLYTSQNTTISFCTPVAVWHLIRRILSVVFSSPQWVSMVQRIAYISAIFSLG